MRFTSQTHCPDCFSDSPAQSECDRCGFNRLLYQDNALYLPEFSLLANGRYVTGRVLGRPGGFGIVYCGWHQGLHRRLAIKEFFPRKLANRDRDSGQITTGQGSDELFEGWKHRFLREARLLARFQSHPHVVTALDVFEENGTAYMIMERLDGENLNEYLGGQHRDDMGRLVVNRTLSLEQAQVLMQALLSALQTLHEDASEPLYHRDLTLNNVLLPEGDLAGAKLLDFGLARSACADPRHTTTIGIGTPGFVAPEQLQREGRIGPYTDFYALGAIFYATLSGQLPPSSYHRMLGQPLTPLAELAPELDPRWCTLIDACLDLDPQHRPQSVAEIRERLAGPMPPAEQSKPISDLDSEKNVLEPTLGAAAQAPAQTRPKMEPEPKVESAIKDVSKQSTPASSDKSRWWLLPMLLTTLALIGVFAGGLYWYLRGQDVQRMPADAATQHEIFEATEPPAEPSLAQAEDTRPVWEAMPPKPEPGPEPERTRLTVKTTPPDAQVRIMNIAPPYEDGIELEPGEYDLQVSAPGYKTYRDWHTLAAGDQELKIDLQKASTVPEPEMVLIDGGCYQMGSPSSEKERYDNERQHEVCVEDFYIGKYEVTFDEYEHFARATGRELPNDRGWGRGRRPVINVSWHDAVAYLDWLGEQSGRRYRLPTEAEWEYAARAGTQTAYWWGDDIGHNRANCANCGSRWDNRQTAPVGSFAANPWGLYDTAGNVYEWTCSLYSSDYDGNEIKCADKNDKEIRVNRGGSWFADPPWLRSAFRYGSEPDFRYGNLGFRPARLP